MISLFFLLFQFTAVFQLLNPGIFPQPIPTSTPTPRPTASTDNIIVMGWDSVDRFAINKLLDEGRLPSIESFLDEGAVMIEAENISATSTVPGWTHVFSGLTYDQTGVFDNKDFGSPIAFSRTLPGKLYNLGYWLGWYASKPFWSDDCASTPLELPLKSV